MFNRSLASTLLPSVVARIVGMNQQVQINAAFNNIKIYKNSHLGNERVVRQMQRESCNIIRNVVKKVEMDLNRLKMRESFDILRHLYQNNRQKFYILTRLSTLFSYI